MKQYIIDNRIYNIKILNELFVTAYILELLKFIVHAINCQNIHNSKGLGDTRYIMCIQYFDRETIPSKSLDSFVENNRPNASRLIAQPNVTMIYHNLPSGLRYTAHIYIHILAGDLLQFGCGISCNGVALNRGLSKFKLSNSMRGASFAFGRTPLRAAQKFERKSHG